MAGTAVASDADDARRSSQAGPGAASPHDGPTPLRLLTARSLWLMPLLRGLLLVVLGILLMVEPLSTVKGLVVIFGVFLLLDALMAITQGLLNRDQIGWKWWLVQGAVDGVFAIIIVLWPGATALVLFYVLVVWTLVLGIVAIIGSVALMRNRDLGWSWLLAIGLLSTLFGFLLITRPTAAADALEVAVLVFGIYAFVSGAIQIVSVFSMRSVAQEIDRALVGQSLVVQALTARQDATTEAKASAAAAKAADRADAARAKEEAKAQAKAGAEDGTSAGGLKGWMAARRTPHKVIHVVDPDDEHHEGHEEAPHAGEPRGEVIGAADAHDRVVTEEMAALAFPDTPGMVVPPVAVRFDEEREAGEPPRP